MENIGKEKVLEKMRRLHNMHRHRSSNPHEAATAAEMLARLAAEHSIELAEIEAMAGERPSGYITVRIEKGDPMEHLWKDMIATIVQNATGSFFVSCYVDDTFWYDVWVQPTLAEHVQWLFSALCGVCLEPERPKTLSEALFQYGAIQTRLMPAELQMLEFSFRIGVAVGMFQASQPKEIQNALVVMTTEAEEAAKAATGRTFESSPETEHALKGLWRVLHPDTYEKGLLAGRTRVLPSRALPDEF
jgi:hypothetical protein